VERYERMIMYRELGTVVRIQSCCLLKYNETLFRRFLKKEKRKEKQMKPY
jgi:hypothetical protein